MAGVRRRDYAAENLGLGLTAIPDPLVHINYRPVEPARGLDPGPDQAELSEIFTTGRRIMFTMAVPVNITVFEFGNLV